MNFYFLGSSLSINGKKTISFPLDIHGLMQVNDLIIVFIYAYNQEEIKLLPKANIYAFDKNAKQVWQIEEPFQPEGRDVSYADISLKKNGDIVAGTSMGTEYLVNIKDGSITPHNTDKRPW